MDGDPVQHAEKTTPELVTAEQRLAAIVDRLLDPHFGSRLISRREIGRLARGEWDDGEGYWPDPRDT